MRHDTPATRVYRVDFGRRGTVQDGEQKYVSLTHTLLIAEQSCVSEPCLAKMCNTKTRT